jgi:hypothetical protein
MFLKKGLNKRTLMFSSSTTNLNWFNINGIIIKMKGKLKVKKS